MPYFDPEGSIEKLGFVAHAINRIYELLPTQSGLSLTNVEDNSVIFVNARKALINIAEAGRFNEILQYSIELLDTLNEADDYLVLKHRQVSSLSSILIIVRLLADLSEINWKAKEPSVRKNSMESSFSSLSVSSDHGVGFASGSVDFHTVQPEKLDSGIAVKAISLISKLKSTNAITQELAMMNGQMLSKSALYEDAETRPIIDQIDQNCETILRFLGATNPHDFYDFITTKIAVFRHNVSNDADFTHYLELFSCVYLHEDLLLEYLKQVRTILSSVKKVPYRQLVFSFLLKAIEVWIQSRPDEFLRASRLDSNVSMEAEVLFEEIFLSSDLIINRASSGSPAHRQFRPSYKFLAFLLTLYPRALHQHLTESSSKPSPLKRIANINNPNKKQKVLSGVVKHLLQPSSKDSNENISVLESLDFMNFIAHVASSIYVLDPQNVTVTFTTNYFELVSNVLVPIASNRPTQFLTHPSLVELSFFNELRLKYHSSLCVIHPKECFPQLMKILVDENSSIESLNISCSILKIYSSLRSLDKDTQQYLIDALPALRSVMIRVSTMVRESTYSGSVFEDEESANLSKTFSSTSNELTSTQYSSLLVDAQSKSPKTIEVQRTPSTLSSAVSTPTAEKLKETTKNFFRGHSSSSQTYLVGNTSDDLKSIESKENSQRISVLSREILISCFGIFKKYPHHYAFKFEDSSLSDKVAWLVSNCALGDPILASLNDSNDNLRSALKDFLHSFFVTTNVIDDLDATIAAFTGACRMGNCICNFILNRLPSESRRNFIFESFVRILEFRIFLHKNLTQHSFFRDVKEAEIPFHKTICPIVEQTLIFCLTSSDQENYGLIKRAFRAYSQELQFNDAQARSKAYSNIDFFVSIAEDKTITTGSVALHKNIQKHFLKIQSPSAAIRESFIRIYEKWYKFARSDYRELSAAELIDFRNYAGFLASISGLFVSIDTPSEIRSEFYERVETFITQQLLLLSNENLITRENAKEILAVETNFRSYPTVIKLLRPYIETLFKKPELSATDLNVVELVIILLKAILDNSADGVLFLISVDILDCAVLLAEMVDSIKSNDKSILKLKMRCSLLFYKIQKYSLELKIQSAYRIRNKFLRFAFNWFEFAASYDPASDKSAQLGHHGRDLEYLYIDLTLESAKAMSILFDDLVLETPKVLDGHELKFYKSRIFSVYFNTLLKALEKYCNSEQFSTSIRHKVETLSEYITVSLTSLLRSNVDIGFAFALPIGYHPDMKVRVAFLKVFTSIFESYSQYDAVDILSKKKLLISVFRDFLENPILFRYISKACPPQEAPAVTSSILVFASAYNQSAPLVSFLLEGEIQAGTSYTDILRRNSFASRSLSAFGRIKGNDYLTSTLRPILAEIRDCEVDLEVEKLGIDHPDGPRNLNNFFHYLKKLVNTIVNSYDKFPLEFKKVCQTISRSVREKFPNYRLVAVGSFIFLRFFCPAIVSPESEKIVDVPNRETQRKFLLLAKVLQNMANGSILSIKWPLIKQREAELLALNEKIMDFLDKVSSSDESIEFEYREPEMIDDTLFSFFHCFFFEHWSDIRAEWCKTCVSSNDVQDGLVLAEKTMEVLKVLGQPTVSFGYEIPASITPENNSELYEFMSKNMEKDTRPLINNPFIRQDITQDGLQLLVFSYSDFDKLDHSDDLALYRIFQVASNVWNQKFALIVDCTGYNLCSSQYSEKTIETFGVLAPSQMHENCVGVYYYNVSSDLYPRLMNSFRNPLLFSCSPGINVNFRSGLDDKKTVVNLGLPKASVKCYCDVRVSFNDVSLYQKEFDKFVPGIVKIGHEYLQITQSTPKRVKLKNEIKSILLNDVYKLDQIASVQTSANTNVPNEITLKFKDGKTVILSSPRYLEIMRLSYFTKNRAYLTVGDSMLSERSEKAVEDLLGQVFNVIFLGLTSSSAKIRGISYNLLAVTQRTFQTDLGRKLHELHEIYFPSDNNSFVIKMSKRLSQSLPHLTFDFIDSFFKIYHDSVTSRQRLSAILYVAPWVDNIYEHVYKTDAEHGTDLVAEIVRKFLEVSTLDPVFLSAFNTSFWSKLCLQQRLSPILVNETVLFAIDREAEGSDWKTIISLLTSSPTIELCTCVIERLRAISHIPFPDESGTSSIAAHSNWIEITVLIQMAVSLVFDNYAYAEMFLPDVFYIVTIFVDVGPSDLRRGSHQLLLNLLQAFLSDPNLCAESRSSILSSVEQLTTHRSRLLFGLIDVDERFPTELSEFSIKITTVESLVTLLLDFIDTSFFEPRKADWISKWKDYIIDAAERKDSMLRGRALMLLGVLSRKGISDNMVIKILEMIVDDAVENVSDPKFCYLAVCTVFSLSNVSLGLLPSSELYSRLFWLALTIAFSDHIPLYQGGIQFVTNILLMMNSQAKFGSGKMAEVLMTDKAIFGPLFERIEFLGDITVAENTFDLILLYLAVKGLQLPHSSSIETMKELFEIRYQNEAERISLDPSAQFNDTSIGYLLFLSILLKDNELKELLERVGLNDDYVSIAEDYSLPRVLANFVLTGSEKSLLVLVIAAMYLNEGSPNDKFLKRFIQILKFISRRSHKSLIPAYCEIQLSLRKMLQTSMNTELVTEIFELASMAYVSEGYDHIDSYKACVDELLKKYRIIGFRNFKFLSEKSLRENTNTDVEDITKLNRGIIIEPIIRRVIESTTETSQE